MLPLVIATVTGALMGWWARRYYYYDEPRTIRVIHEHAPDSDDESYWPQRHIDHLTEDILDELS